MEQSLRVLRGLRRYSLKYDAASAGGKFTFTRDCPKAFETPARRAGGAVNTMAVGRLGEIAYSGGAQATAALLGMIGTAKRVIRISQQNIEGPSSKWPDDFLDALAARLVDGIDVYIVQSSDDAGGSGGSIGGSLSGYSNGTLTDLANKLRSKVSKSKNAPKSASDLNKLLCTHLYLAQIRFADGVNSYPGKKGIPNHAKVVAADDSAFYIGSQNIYPPNRNMEFGVIVSDTGAFSTWRSSYWDQLWQYSKQTAISGGSPPNCYYR